VSHRGCDALSSRVLPKKSARGGDGAAGPRVPFDASHRCVAVFDNPEWISTDNRVIVNFDERLSSAAIFDRPEGNST
jgi:hypothetical protein